MCDNHWAKAEGRGHQHIPSLACFQIFLLAFLKVGAYLEETVHTANPEWWEISPGFTEDVAEGPGEKSDCFLFFSVSCVLTALHTSFTMLLAEVSQGFLTAYPKPASWDDRSVGFCRAESFWRDLCDQRHWGLWVRQDALPPFSCLCNLVHLFTAYFLLGRTRTCPWAMLEHPGRRRQCWPSSIPWDTEIKAGGSAIVWASCSPLLPACPQGLRHFSSPL